MSGTTLVRGFMVFTALALSACATTTAPVTTQSLIDNMRRAPSASVATCAAAGMALYCESSIGSRYVSHVNRGDRCSCADRYDLTSGGAWH